MIETNIIGWLILCGVAVWIYRVHLRYVKLIKKLQEEVASLTEELDRKKRYEALSDRIDGYFNKPRFYKWKSHDAE